MTTFTFAGDEAGDVSFSFTKGASRYFVAAVIATQAPDDLRAALAAVRRSAHLPEDFDFHFNRLASARLHDRVFSALRDAEFGAWAIMVDKPVLPDTFRVMSSIDFYLYFVAELLGQIPASERQHGALLLDEYGSAQRVRTELKRVLRARGIEHGFRRILVRRSHRKSLIQVADLVAGAVFRRNARQDVAAFEVIQAKFRGLVAYPVRGNEPAPLA